MDWINLVQGISSKAASASGKIEHCLISFDDVIDAHNSTFF